MLQYLETQFFLNILFNNVYLHSLNFVYFFPSPADTTKDNTPTPATSSPFLHRYNNNNSNNSWRSCAPAARGWTPQAGRRAGPPAPRKRSAARRTLQTRGGAPQLSQRHTRQVTPKIHKKIIYYTLKKVSCFHMPGRDVTYQTLPGHKKINYSRPGRVW